MSAVVLTGVSRGLGAALFDALAARGDAILALGRGFTAPQRRLAAAEPERIRLRPADLADPAGLPDAAELAGFLDPAGAGRHGTALILNAAVVEPIGAVGTLPAADLAAAVTVNLTAPMVLANAFLAATGGATDTAATGGGTGGPAARRDVLLVSSGAARRVIGGWSAYCATKAGAEMFFAVLAEQVAGQAGTRVVAVDPGQMDTGMQEEIRAAYAAGRYFPDGARWRDNHAQGRMATPATVARRIVAEHLGTG